MGWNPEYLSDRQKARVNHALGNSKQTWLNDRRIRSKMLEADFQKIIVELATLRGWDWIWHDNDARKNKEGKPDLELGRSVTGEYFHAELKTKGKEPEPHQWQAIQTLRECGQTVYVWLPEDWPEIVNTLW
jgi:hypothetical protein